MKKVLILGCPGAGKSTFARKLRDKTGLPLYYLDMIWHKPDRTTITKQEFDAKLSEIIKQEEELSAEFRDFIINFSRDEIPEINEMLRKYKNKNIIIFKSREEIDAWK